MVTGDAIIPQQFEVAIRPGCDGSEKWELCKGWLRVRGDYYFLLVLYIIIIFTLYNTNYIKT